MRHIKKADEEAEEGKRGERKEADRKRREEGRARNGTVADGAEDAEEEGGHRVH